MFKMRLVQNDGWYSVRLFDNSPVLAQVHCRVIHPCKVYGADGILKTVISGKQLLKHMDEQEQKDLVYPEDYRTTRGYVITEEKSLLNCKAYREQSIGNLFGLYICDHCMKEFKRRAKRQKICSPCKMKLKFNALSL